MEYADSKGSGYGTHDDYPNEYRHRERYMDDAHSTRSSHRSYTPHAPHAGDRGYHSHVSSEIREPRNTPLNGSRITVTSYRIPTQGGFTSTISYQEYHTTSTSYRGHRSYTVFDSHRSSSGLRESWSDLDDEDERSFSDREKHHKSRSNDRREEDAKGNRTDHHHRHRDQRPDRREEDAKGNRTDHHHRHRDQRPDRWEEDAKGNRTDHHHRHRDQRPDRWEEDAKGNRTDHHHRNRDQRPYQEKPKEPKATYADSSKSKSYSNRYTTNNSPGQGKRESDSSQRANKPHSSRNDDCRKENPGSNRSDPFHKDHGGKSRQEIPQPRAKEELPDHYGTLRLDPLATDEEIKSAAKRRRVEVHPDKLKKPGMSTSELAKIDDAAAKVGQAADVLQNPKQKLEYDRKMNAVNH